MASSVNCRFWACGPAIRSLVAQFVLLGTKDWVSIMSRLLLLFREYELSIVKSLRCSALWLFGHFPRFNPEEINFTLTVIWNSRTSDSNRADVFSVLGSTLQRLEFLVDIELRIPDNRETPFDCQISFFVAFLRHHRWRLLSLVSERVICSSWATRLHHASHVYC